MFVVLRVPLDSLSNKGSAIGLDDCPCIGLEVSEKTDGETVASALTDIFKRSGDPTVILKDGGLDLDRGVGLWRAQENKQNVFVIDDLGHWIANALKAQFEKSKIFQAFLSLIGKGAARLRQTSLAFLIPPKIRTKGRFMSMSKLGDWASHLLVAIASRGRAKEKSQLDRLRKAMPGFCAFRSFIERFALNVKTMAAIMKILKHKGLNQKTYHQTMNIVQTLPSRSKESPKN